MEFTMVELEQPSDMDISEMKEEITEAVIKVKAILHNEHSPEMCAFQTQMVHERNLRLEQQILNMLDNNCKYIEENGKLKVEAQRALLDLKLCKLELAKREEELLPTQGDLAMAKEELKQIQRENSQCRLNLEELREDLELAQTAKSDLERQNFEMAIEMDKIKQKMRTLVEDNKKQADAAVRCMQEAQEYVAQKDEEIAAELAELDQQKTWINQKTQEVQDYRQEFELWEKEKQAFEMEIGRLREVNRSLRQKAAMQYKTNDTKMLLANSVAREEELHRQLHNANLHNIELEKQLKEYHVRQHKRMTFAKPTQASSSKN